MAEKIYGLMVQAKRAIAPVAKARMADAGSMKYAYRGIDDLSDAVFPILNDLGIMLLPKVEKIEEGVRGEKALPFTRIHMSYTFVCEDGSSVRAESIGQAVSGQKGGDKEATVAQSIALRIMLATTFSVPFSEMTDPEDFEPQDETPASRRFIADLKSIVRRDALVDLMKRVIAGIEAGTGQFTRAHLGECRSAILECAERIGFDPKAVKGIDDRITEVVSGKPPAKTEEPQAAIPERDPESHSEQLAGDVIEKIAEAKNRAQFEAAVAIAASGVANGDLMLKHAVEVAKSTAISEDASCHLLTSLIRATTREGVGAIANQISEMEAQRKINKETAAALRSMASVITGSLAK